MPNTAATACGTGAQGNLAAGFVAWSNPTRITADDASSATAVIGTTAGTKSNSLEATNFGFALPASSTVVGIVAEWKIFQGVSAGTGAYDSAVFLIRSGVIIAGCVDKASATAFPTFAAFRSFGASNDPWGTVLTETQTNDATFGVYMTAKNDDPDVTASVDFVRMTIYYTSSSTDIPRVRCVVAYRPIHPMEILE